MSRNDTDEEGSLNGPQLIVTGWKVYAGCLLAAGQTVSPSWDDLNDDERDAFTAGMIKIVDALQHSQERAPKHIAALGFVAYENQRTSGHPGHVPLTTEQGKKALPQLPPEIALAWELTAWHLHNALEYNAEDHGSLVAVEELAIEGFKSAFEKAKGAT